MRVHNLQNFLAAVFDHIARFKIIDGVFFRVIVNVSHVLSPFNKKARPSEQNVLKINLQNDMRHNKADAATADDAD